jgi:hypothetical protein
LSWAKHDSSWMEVACQGLPLAQMSPGQSEQEAMKIKAVGQQPAHAHVCSAQSATKGAAPLTC